MKTMHQASQRSADDYLRLVQRFPLRPLRTQAEHDEAVRVLGRLDGRAEPPLGAGERDYAEAIAHFIKAYEDARHRPHPAMSPVRIIRFLMEQHQMNTEALGKVLGSQTAASLVLNGKRELSKNHIRRLARHFKVDPGALI